jgi:fucose permease
MTIIGAVTFSQFFVLTLYLQNVLHYTPMQSGAAFAAFALAVVVFSNVAQAVVGRIGVRPTLTTGLLFSATALGVLTRLPVHGHYFFDLFPAFVLGGAGLGLSFVPVTIASLTGVDRSDAGIASGLVNTSRQIGGAIGLAAVTAIAASSTNGYLHTHRLLAASNATALDHGFQTSLWVLTGALLAGAALVSVLLSPPRAHPSVEEKLVVLDEAA